MRCKPHYLGLFAVVLLLPQPASAHFLWLVTDHQSSPAQVKVYFGESAEPDDPDLLDRVKDAQLWAVAGRGEPKALKLTKGDDALVAELPGAASAPVMLKHTYGVVSRGDATFLLNYYAKTYPSPLPGNWRSVRDEERLPLEVTPSIDGDAIVLRVRWKGEAAAGATVSVEGPGASCEGEVDSSGNYRCELTKAGTYSIRARLIQNEAGEHNGESFQESRHYSTLTLDYQPAELDSVAHELPALPQGTTSIGAAIAGNAVYVYGGNYGDAHEYSSAGQSGDLWKLDLSSPTAWQQAAGGPKLQGLALVAHQQYLYRVGGFTAVNEEGEDEDLRSQASFARFDTVKGTWEDLAPLPQPRSSHDAAVIDGVLYVVGGWNLQGGGAEAHWHETAWSVDLNQETLTWKPIAQPPFQRRALALAAYSGKLYCLGGMQQQGGPTRQVTVYDPATDMWTEASPLLGEAMDGFGASAFACGNALYATTISGSIQRLSSDNPQWQYVGQLNHPRFFHRVLCWDDSKLLIVAGGSMSVGKVEDLEVVPVAAQ